MGRFIGRKREIMSLSGLRNKDTASLVVVHGRRRIGKSRLIEEFGEQTKFLTFSGLFPDKAVNNQAQLNEFKKRLSQQLSISIDPFDSWSDAFYQLAKLTRNGKVTILFDELSWMASDDCRFLGQLKNAWDMEFKKNDQLILVLCSSVSIWMEKNLLSSKAFFGRISLKIKLEELSIAECNQFWTGKSSISSYDKIKLLSVTGGIPKYLEEIHFNQSADDNIKQLCFNASGLLLNDYDYIFASMLERDSVIYQLLVEALADGPLLRDALLDKIGKRSGGVISDYIDELESSGFVVRDYTWNLRSHVLSKLSQYRLSDNYIRFYIKYIKPQLAAIKAGKFNLKSLTALPAWPSVVALQVENLVLNNRKGIFELMGIYPDEVICDGPFFQRQTTRMRGCQVDYLIQIKLGVLYLCEVKFTRNVIKPSIIEEIAEKIKRLQIPKNFSVVPVLIHVGDVHDQVYDSQFFGKIIDLTQLLNE